MTLRRLLAPAAVGMFITACTGNHFASPDFASSTRRPIVLSTSTVRIIGEHARIEPTPRETHVGWWDNADTTVQWNVPALGAGTYQIDLLYALDQDFSGSTITATLAGQSRSAELHATRSWDDYQILHLGSVTIDRSGRQTVSISVLHKPRLYVMNLQQVILTPLPAPR